MKNRVFRILVVVVLVCYMIVNVVSIRARASALPEVVGVVTEIIPLNPGAGAAAGGAALGTQVFGYVLGGIGLIVTTAQVIELMDAYIEFSGELETSIYYYPDGTWSYGVDMGFVERVRAFLFDSGTLLVEQEFPYDDYVGYSQKFHEFYLSCIGHPYYFLAYSLTLDRWCCGFSDEAPFIATFSNHNDKYNVDIYYISCGDGLNFSYRTMNSDGSGSAQTAYGGIGTITWWSSTMNGETVVSADPSIDLGQVAPLEVPMPDAYPEWHTNARPATNPDTQEEITVLPIPLDPNIQELPDTLTQPDIWQGTVADPYPDLDTNPDTGTDTDPDGGTSGDAPSADIDDYRLDLTSFFPFCIPFDVARFVNVLQADPVAPCFEFELQLPFQDEPYLIVIDLAPFDSLAALVRRLELLGFCIALAVATRNFYIRG